RIALVDVRFDAGVGPLLCLRRRRARRLRELVDALVDMRLVLAAGWARNGLDHVCARVGVAPGLVHLVAVVDPRRQIGDVLVLGRRRPALAQILILVYIREVVAAARALVDDRNLMDVLVLGRPRLGVLFHVQVDLRLILLRRRLADLGALGRVLVRAAALLD